MHVLRVDVDVLLAERIGDRGQCDRRGGNTHAHAIRDPLGDRTGQLDRVGDGWRVHLPVADHEPLAH